MKNELVEAIVHSRKPAVEMIEILHKKGDNQFIVKTKDGTICSAIYNWFNGYYYADDKYGVIHEEDY